jgi:hypothetical protein
MPVGLFGFPLQYQPGAGGAIVTEAEWRACNDPLGSASERSPPLSPFVPPAGPPHVAGPAERGHLMLTAALIALSLAAGQTDDEKRLARLLEQIMPDKGELAWLRLPWHTSIRDGLLAARKEGKPLLLYAMNGHPMTVC